MSSILGALGINLGAQGVLSGLSAAGGVLSEAGLGQYIDIIPQGNIGGITIQATFEETLTDTIQITEHPVQAGVNISDHAYVRNPECVLKCGWSNSNGIAGVLGEVSGLANAAIQEILSGSTATGFTDDSFPASAGYVSTVYQQLLKLQQSLTVFNVNTTIRNYTNMLMTSLQVTRDQKTSQALMVTATCRQIKVVSTSSATLPAIQNMLNQANSSTVDTGVQAPISSDAISANGSYNPFSQPTTGFS